MRNSLLHKEPPPIVPWKTPWKSQGGTGGSSCMVPLQLLLQKDSGGQNLLCGAPHPKKTFCAHQGPQLGDPSPLSQSRPQGGSHQEPAGARPGNTQLGLELILPSCPSPQPEHNVWGTAAPFSRCCWKATRSRKAGAGIWLLHKKGSDGSSSPANTNPAGTARPRLFGMFPCVPVLKNQKEKSFPSPIALGKRFP